MNPGSNNEDPNKTNSSGKYSYDEQTEASGTAFQGIDPYATDFIKDPQNFHDPVEELKAKKKTNKIIAASVAIAITVGVGLFTYNLVTSDSPTNQETNQTQKENQTQNNDNKTSEVIKPELPLAAAYTDSPATPKGFIKAEVKKKALTLSNGYEVTVNNHEVKKVQQDCTVSKKSEFCLASRVKIDESKEVFIYLLKDATNSRLMEKPENFNITGVNGAKVSATMKIALPNPGTQILTTVNKDNSGLIFAFPENMNTDEITEFSKKIIIKEKS